jgi:hypothetical protein
MSKANTELLEKIHNLIAKDMLNRLEDGACEAKDWAVIVKFLKDNNIDALPSTDEDGANAFADLVRTAQASIERAR